MRCEQSVRRPTDRSFEVRLGLRMYIFCDSHYGCRPPVANNNKRCMTRSLDTHRPRGPIAGTMYKRDQLLVPTADLCVVKTGDETNSAFASLAICTSGENPQSRLRYPYPFPGLSASSSARILSCPQRKSFDALGW